MQPLEPKLCEVVGSDYLNVPSVSWFDWDCVPNWP
uniref:Uncharacterized protein n=1 Tax=Anguilla anguilla TaxID=7936 RepID=A0A0E9QID9_ANGAN